MTYSCQTAEATQAGRPGLIRYQHHSPNSPLALNGPPYAINPNLAQRELGGRGERGQCGSGGVPRPTSPALPKTHPLKG
ncbi:MAG: hypothetical protein [Arizlama microvirus]|nr:MAG: hypothetical protein [Arizlama microvirus]